MDDQREDLDARLARLAGATAKVGPRAGFASRVQRAIEAEREADFRQRIVRAGRLVLAAAAVLALGTVSFAVEQSRAADASIATSYGLEEPTW